MLWGLGFGLQGLGFESQGYGFDEFWGLGKVDLDATSLRNLNSGMICVERIESPRRLDSS